MQINEFSSNNTVIYTYHTWSHTHAHTHASMHAHAHTHACMHAGTHTTSLDHPPRSQLSLLTTAWKENKSLNLAWPGIKVKAIHTLEIKENFTIVCVSAPNQQMGCQNVNTTREFGCFSSCDCRTLNVVLWRMHTVSSEMNCSSANYAVSCAMVKNKNKKPLTIPSYLFDQNNGLVLGWPATQGSPIW